MKRHANLWGTLISFPYLWASAMKARQGKRCRPDVAAFHFRLEPELFRLQDELLSGRYRPGRYRLFRLCDPAPRLICAAPYRDRIVHHALCGVLEPLYELQFNPHSYASRAGKGTHRAVARASQLAAAHPFALKCDLRKYFASIDHELLLGLLARKIKDGRVLDLARLIVAHSPPQEDLPALYPDDRLFAATRRRGLPLGNQTSQFFANVYLDVFDRFVWHNLEQRTYIRYVDDFVIFGSSKRRLAQVREQCHDFLARMGLRLHPDKSVILRSRDGVPFLGYRVFPTHRLLARAGVTRMRRRLRWLAGALARGEVSREDVDKRWAGWWGHARHARSRALRMHLGDGFHQRYEAAAAALSANRIEKGGGPGR